MARLRLEALAKVFPARPEPVRAVDGLYLELEEGELLVLLGPSGCGKTTTLRLIAGLETPTEGTIYLDDKNLTGASPRARNISMLFQNPALFPQLTVLENLELGFKLRKRAAEEARMQIQDVAGLLHISDLLPRYPEQLSGGQQQRVALGRALVNSPRVLLLDEPLSNLDPVLRAELRAEIRAIQKSAGVSMIYVTHDQAEAMALGSRIAVMNRGRIEQIGTASELYYSPVNLFVARFIGTPQINVLQGYLQKETGSEASPGSFELAINPGSGCASGAGALLGIRPEQVRFVERDGVRAQVEEITLALPDVFVRLDLAGQTVIARAAFPFPHEVGSIVFVNLKTENTLLFNPATGAAM